MTHAELMHLLRGVSRTFHLSMRLLPFSLRPTIALAYALARLSDTIADSASLPRQEKVRLLRGVPPELPTIDVPDADEARLLAAYPQLLDRLGRSSQEEDITMVWDVIRQGQIFDLERFPSTEPLSATELDRYAYMVAGSVGEFWTRQCFKHVPGFSAKPLEEMLVLGRDFGKALQRVNILRDRHADAMIGRLYVTSERFDEEFALAREGVQAGIAYASSIRKRRVRAATMLPALLADETLDLLATRRAEPRVRIPRAAVWRSVVVALTS